MRRLVALTLAMALLSGCVGPFAPEQGMTFEVVFTRTNNLFEGSDVRILGVPKGKVLELRPEGADVVAVVQMQPDVELPADVRASVAPTSLLGERFVQLQPPYTGGPKLEDGAVIGKDRTAIAADIDEVLHGFERFLEGMDEETLAELVDVLVATLEGQGDGLNRLLGQGAETVRVLRRSSGDLNTAVSQLANLNETVAQRDEELGAMFDDLSAVMRLIADESPEIIEGIRNLRRLSNELRPLVDDHGDALVRDLEILATSLSTVERNLDRVATAVSGGRKLFTAAGRAIDYEHAMLRLDNEGEQIPAVLTDRLINRLAGVCIRLGIDECSDKEFFEPLLPVITCVPNFQECDTDETSFGDAVLAGLNLLPRRARVELEREIEQEQQRERRRNRRQQDQQDAQQSRPRTSPSPSPSPTPLTERLPLPDPTLEQQTPRESMGDRLSRWLGGG
ncbi:MAG TPA: MCE family protein [Egibacteraceae bacterium]|nr:MCE family protein [Egibacteraceae bacterium]